MLLRFADAWLGPRCAACGAAHGFAAVAAVCEVCAARWQPCRAREPVPGVPQVLAPWDYSGTPRLLILRAKEAGGEAAARALWQAALLRWPAALLAPPRALLVPAPPSRRRGRASLAEVLAAEIAAHGGLAHRRWLRRTARRPPQASLDGAARRANLRGVLALRRAARVELVLRPELRRHPIWLCDDVATTGATLAECARALRGAGLRVAGALVWARVA